MTSTARALRDFRFTPPDGADDGAEPVEACRVQGSMVFVIIAVTAAALILGALWGLFGRFPRKVEGFTVAMAGGALIVSVMLELLQPASDHANLAAVLAVFAAGAVVFTAIDTWLDRRNDSSSGLGLLLAIVLDGIPENLALGVALITAEPMAVLALAGSIFLSNLPEAAGGARAMRDDGDSRMWTFGIWVATAAILGLSALAGNLLFSPLQETTLALIKSFAAGAVVASLATEVFPKAYRDDHDMTGIAVALGVAIAFALSTIG